LTISCSKEIVDFKHKGFHNHAKPFGLRPDLESKHIFVERVKANPQATPMSLAMGTETREPMIDQHDSFLNRGRVETLRGNTLKENNSTLKIKDTLGALATHVTSLLSNGSNLMPSSSIGPHDGHVSFQSDFMAERTRTLEGCMQTDSVHAFIRSTYINDINVTFTSRYCPVLGRTVYTFVDFIHVWRDPASLREALHGSS
jgi:hypothetical protein